MYAHLDEGSIEQCCYDNGHIAEAVKAIENNFCSLFQAYLDEFAGHYPSVKYVIEEAKKHGIDIKIASTKPGYQKDRLSAIVANGVEEFEKNRQAYLNIMDSESLEEYAGDPADFKSRVLKNECPIIHSTIFNKAAKVLDKYRYEFNISDPGNLLKVVTNLNNFADQYATEYNEDTYGQIVSFQELGISALDTEKYTAYGVIGGGIKSELLYKKNPIVFPSRSRDAIWSLWYLTDKQDFGCRYDSEFLMIDVEKTITQQNYFYPYELFTFYALEIYRMITRESAKFNYQTDIRYRYIYVDSILSYIAEKHRDEINTLSRQIVEGNGYA